MGSFSYDYDTTAVRREARKLKECYKSLDSSALPRVKSARSSLDGNFEGRTADALENRLNQTYNQIYTLRQDLSRLYTALMDFADRLEEADERAKRLMGNG